MGNTITNLFQRLFSKKELRILILGLDAAGKTTILYRLKLGEVVTTIPTIGCNVETIQHKNVNFTVWDLGVHKRDWGLGGHLLHFYQFIQGLIFVVDSTDRDRIAEAREWLHQLLSNQQESHDVELLVFANKQDLGNPMNEAEVAEKLGLKALSQKWHVQKTSATSGEGLYEGLEWLSTNISSSIRALDMEGTQDKFKRHRVPSSISALPKFLVQNFRLLELVGCS